MKKAIILFAILFMATATQAQNAKVDATGNYVALTKENAEPGKETGRTFTDREGVKFPVLETKAGKLYYIRVSKKTQKEYKAYLKLYSTEIR